MTVTIPSVVLWILGIVVGLPILFCVLYFIWFGFISWKLWNRL